MVQCTSNVSPGTRASGTVHTEAAMTVEMGTQKSDMSLKMDLKLQVETRGGGSQ